MTSTPSPMPSVRTKAVAALAVRARYRKVPIKAFVIGWSAQSSRFAIAPTWVRLIRSR